jgi:hypothetical protein
MIMTGFMIKCSCMIMMPIMIMMFGASKLGSGAENEEILANSAARAKLRAPFTPADILILRSVSWARP